MHNQECRIGFLLLDQHLGRGGGENVIKNISIGLKEHQIRSHAYMLDPALHTDFLSAFEEIHISKKYSILKTLQQHSPKFIARVISKLCIKLKVKCLFKTINSKKKLDALILLNLSETFNLAAPTIQKSISKLQIPLISWPHGTLSVMKPKTQKRLKKNISICSAHFAISQGIAQELKEIYHQKNTYLIYNPILPATIIPRQHNRFIYLGRIGDPIKRVPELLNTLQRLQGEWFLDIFGSAGSPEKDLAFSQHLATIDPHQKITFHGWKENPWKHITKAGVLLLNSTNEGFSLVLAEAMMRGIPCVSTDCPVGPNEIIQPNVNGWLFEVNNDEHCQQILQEIIDGERTLPHPETVRSSVMKFSLEKVILDFKKNLLELIKKK